MPINKDALLAVVARDDATAVSIATQLQGIIAPFVKVEHLSMERGLCPLMARVVLVTSPRYIGRIFRFVQPGTDVLAVRRTLLRESWERVMAIPSGTRALLVNDIKESALETISLLHELGVRHLELIPMYPGLKSAPEADLAITPGEPEYVPAGVKHVIDLGPRVVDGGQVAEVLSKFGLLNVEPLQAALARYMERTLSHSMALKTAFERLGGMRAEMEAVFDSVQEGVVAYDSLKRVTLFNRGAEELFGRARWEVVGQDVGSVFEKIEGAQSKKLAFSLRDHLCRLRGREILLTHIELPVSLLPEQASGGVMIIKEASKVVQQEQNLRRELKARGLVARYTFDDIAGQSALIQRTVQRARRLAAGDGVVLIYGETGTGKELFAQAIHNASRRREYPFVAVNCAALPETLLESELFGYEEGAFTGARRGGKPGLFEQAHLGTIFLDEIGDISPGIQARLLRILQEKEVMRVGGTRLKSVDIRIIAATNQELKRLVKEGRFRPDLFYRLNVLPLTIPPLRSRKEDIPLLIERFFAEMGDARRPGPELLSIFLRHGWPGNVRELRNCVEYLVNIADGEFGAGDLPPFKDLTLADLRDDLRDGLNDSQTNLAPLDSALAPLPEDLLSVLRIVAEVTARGQTIGRRRLAHAAQEHGLALSEEGVRVRLARLSELGWISVGVGRRGCALTVAGHRILDSVNRS